MEEYLENLGTFYDEKVKFLSQKDKFINCNNCPEKKQFKETYEELSLTCGGKEGSECGTQLVIRFPKYLHYEKTLDILKEKVNDNINWSIINNYMNVEGIKDKQNMIDEIKGEIFKIEQAFIKENIKNKEKLIQSFYDERIKKTNECEMILDELKKKIDPEQRTRLKETYVQNVIELNKEYSNIKSLIDDINPYLLVEEPEVTIKNKNFEVNNTKKKKQKKEIIQYNKGDSVTWKLKGEKQYGIIQEIKGKKAIIINTFDKKVFVLLSNLEIAKTPSINIDEFEPEPEVEEVEEIKYTNKDWLSTFNIKENFKYKDNEYTCVENAYHAQKVDDNDEKVEQYRNLFSSDQKLKPSDASNLGSNKFFNENEFKLRMDWNKIKVNIMEDITKEYLQSNKDIIDKLINTGDKKLIYIGENKNDFWGVINNEGQNYHGKLMMKLRDEFKSN
tara:strand:+ start:2169 stop:3506 length:1338 start_codon:yes stop_codon:yes gene_type:complete